MKDYTGKKIFSGIDMHKNGYSVTAFSDGQILKKDQLPANVNKLVSYCKKHFPGAPTSTAYEAGFCGYSLRRKLTRVFIGYAKTCFKENRHFEVRKDFASTAQQESL